MNIDLHDSWLQQYLKGGQLLNESCSLWSIWIAETLAWSGLSKDLHYHVRFFTFRVLSNMWFMIVDPASQNYHFVIVMGAFFPIIKDDLFMDHILKVLLEGTFNEVTTKLCKRQLVNKDWNEMIQSCPMDLFCFFPRYQSVYKYDEPLSIWMVQVSES